jgi:aspartyl-tRNA(Asn)/glutamyl-tRNA(Gln) amidotransferase subunit A
MSLLALSATVLAARVRSGSVPAAHVVEESLARIAAENPRLGAVLHVAAGPARDAAQALDRKVARGDDPGPLAGVPVLLKDNISTAGIPTTAGSRILEGNIPLFDATVVEKLRASGAIVIGKTNLDEFAMGSSTENSGFAVTRNPWDPTRVPGGSSGGSAAAVASGMSVLALGSDTGGSVRQPASFCGVHGLLPTYGRVSRYGLIAFASSLDQIGPLARHADDVRILFEAVAGPDPRDSTSWPGPLPATGASGGPLRVGVAAGLLGRKGVETRVATQVEQAARVLEQRGARLSTVELPDPDTAVATYYLIATAEASSNLARYDGVRYGLRVPGDGLDGMMRRTRSTGFGREVKRRILLGTFVLSAGYYDAYYVRAQKSRARLRRQVLRLFESVDLVLLPTSPTTAFRIGDRVEDPLAMYLADVFTVYANLAGIPALNVPVGRDAAGLPVGAQLLAAPFREDLLFAAAKHLEESGAAR